MASNPSGDATTVVIEMEPGWIYVKVADPKPASNRIELLLRKTVDAWFALHPRFVIDKAEVIANHGEMLGVHVWYHPTTEQVMENRQEDNVPDDTISVEIHSVMAERFPMEYLEAVIDDARKILPSYRHRDDSLVVINPRRVAVILHAKARRGAVIPLDFVEQVIGGPMKQRLQQWLDAPATPFYIMHIAGNWFGIDSQENPT